VNTTRRPRVARKFERSGMTHSFFPQAFKAEMP
jgi:hypothetical protein